MTLTQGMWILGGLAICFLPGFLYWLTHHVGASYGYRPWRREMIRDVTLHDFIMPQFRGADPKDYEFRKDGKIVRKDRWENGIHKIRRVLGDNRREFEIDDIVAAVEALVNASLPSCIDDEREEHF